MFYIFVTTSGKNLLQAVDTMCSASEMNKIFLRSIKKL